MGAAIYNFESQVVNITLALQMYDGFTSGTSLLGNVTAQVVNGENAMVKANAGQLLFFTLSPGTYNVDVIPDPLTSYYLPVTLSLTLPMSTPQWPAFPDRALANPTLPLDDPAQPAVYRQQRALATLQPAVAYPFPGTASLVRGTVLFGGNPLSGATVTAVGGDQRYTTAADGQYVLFFLSVAGTGDSVTVQVSHPAHATITAAITVRRSITTTQDFVMA